MVKHKAKVHLVRNIIFLILHIKSNVFDNHIIYFIDNKEFELDYLRSSINPTRNDA